MEDAAPLGIATAASLLSIGVAEQRNGSRLYVERGRGRVFVDARP